MDDAGVGPQDQARGGNTIALFLALYLLILAFFILLVTISTREQVKSTAVMNSLTSTFAAVLPPSTDLTAFIAKEGDVIAGEVFQERVTGIFATVVRVAKVDVVLPGRLMRVTLPVEALFHSEEARVRDSHSDLLDRLVAAISSRPPGLRFDMEFVVGVARGVGASGGTQSDGRSARRLAMNRAGQFAREVEGRGAPPDSVSIALSTEHPADVVIWFHVRDVAESRLRFVLPPSAADRP